MLKIKTPINTEYPFKTVNKGDIFEFNKRYYMKTELAKIPNAGEINSINLKSGELTYFDSECKVYLLDGEMTLVRRDMSPYEK